MDARPDVDDQVDPPRPEGPTSAGTSPSDETPPSGDVTGADPAAPDDVVTLPEHGTGQRAQRRRRRERREHSVTWLLALLGVGILAALPLVALVGLRTVDELKSEDARKVNNDPEAPGYEAFTTPTPTAIVVVGRRHGKAPGHHLPGSQSFRRWRRPVDSPAHGGDRAERGRSMDGGSGER